jgi:ssDNA-binding Zn-finger/Zn-ribbon topoisomerase 1
MALKQISPPPESDRIRCPRCGEEAIIIDGRFVRWLNCPKCKFKKLLEKEDETTKVKVRDV